jgi:Sel1 repeat
MRSIWKVVAILVACVAVIAGIGFGWRAHRAKMKLAEAARVCRLRAEQGDAQAEYDLGKLYYYGKGVPQSYAEAAEWERKGADHGNAAAQAHLGYLYLNGQGVPQDYALALLWIRKAADQGYVGAEDDVGYMYYHGEGVTQDYVEAMRWYREAAAQGNRPAQFALGIFYELGVGTPQDYAEAARWYRKAADQGEAHAEDNLGNLYFYGKGVPQDRAEAYRWFHKAADQGDDYGNRSLSQGQTSLGKFNRVAELLVGLWLSLNFLSFNYLVPNKSLRYPKQRIITVAGVLWIAYAGLSWYGYSHHKIRYLTIYPNAFTLLRLLLLVIAIGFLIYVVRLWSKESSDGSSENVMASEEEAQG